MRGRLRPALRRWWVVALAALLTLIAIQALVVKLYTIPTESMRPTLDVGDRVLVSRLGWEPQHGDLVVFVEGGTPSLLGDVFDVFGLGSDRQVVKRVVAVPGDVVESSGDGRLVVNGHITSEPYLPVGSTISLQPVTVVEGSVFVLGDNRNFSRDSRTLGPVPLESVVGEVTFRVWPLNSAGALR